MFCFKFFFSVILLAISTVSLDLNSVQNVAKTFLRSVPSKDASGKDESSSHQSATPDPFWEKFDAEMNACFNTPSPATSNTPPPPSFDWCQVLVDELFAQLKTRGTIVDSLEILLPQLTACIEFITPQQVANTRNLKLRELQTRLLDLHMIVRELLRSRPPSSVGSSSDTLSAPPMYIEDEEAASTNAPPEDPEFENQDTWQPPAPELLPWLQVPHGQIQLLSEQDEADHRMHCNQLVTFVQTNYRPRAAGPPLNRWDIPRESFERRLRQCRDYFNAMGNVEKCNVLRGVIRRFANQNEYKRMRGGKTRGRPVEPAQPSFHDLGPPTKQPRTLQHGQSQWPQPEPVLLSWLQQIESQYEHSALFCNQLFTYLQDNNATGFRLAGLLSAFAIPKTVLATRLLQCRAFFEGQSDADPMKVMWFEEWRRRLE